LSKWLYDAIAANRDYKSTLSDSRSGISLNDAELKQIDEIISPLLKKGQSVRNICSRKRDELLISDKTIYKYLELGLLSADLFDLKRKVQRKTRKKAGPAMLVDTKSRSGRLYDDYKKHMDGCPDRPVVEMDTVEGKKGGKVILTLLFNNCNLQLGFLRERNDAASVSKVFEKLRDILEANEFAALFPVLLADRGTEFSDPKKIEIDSGTGEAQSRLFYCDPQNTNQKSRCEKNHEFIRYVMPKGVSLDNLTQDDVNIIMNHINSYGREKYNFKSPLEIFESIYGAEIVKKLGIKLIPPNEICLTPKLLKK
jgi:IS30 family transposase